MASIVTYEILTVWITHDLLDDLLVDEGNLSLARLEATEGSLDAGVLVLLILTQCDQAQRVGAILVVGLVQDTL